MKYLCLVYLENEKMHAVPDSECQACGDGFRKSGLLLAAEALMPVDTATTVRVRNGRTTITDGPFAETKEQLLGFYLLDCATFEEALEETTKLARERESGALEIRPLLHFMPGKTLG